MLHRSHFYPLVAGIFMLSCVAQAQTEPSTTGTQNSAAKNSAANAAGDARAVFVRLDAYVKANPLEFSTSFNAFAEGDELYRGSGHFLIRQPNLLRAETSLGRNSYSVTSDGTILTIYNPQQKKYSQAAAPNSVGRAFSFFAGEIGIDSQVLNFFGVVDDVVSGSTDGMKVSAAGSETIGGRQCDKFTVSDPTGVNRWEAWLERSDTPLLCRLIYRSVDGPTQTNEFTWKPTPVISQATFSFTPPAGSTKVDVGSLSLVAPD